VLTGCGGTDDGGRAPAPSGTTRASGSGEDEVRAVVAGFHAAYVSADTGICRFLAPSARDELMREIQTRRPRLFGKRCGNAFVAFFGSLPRSQRPPAATQARPSEVSVSGDSATARFREGASWRLVRGTAGWQIEEFPILPAGGR
jgi:hypothetical protein